MAKAQPCETCGSRVWSECICIGVYDCSGCGKTFERRVYLTRKNNPKYCDKNCPALTKKRGSTTKLPYHYVDFSPKLILKENS